MGAPARQPRAAGPVVLLLVGALLALVGWAGWSALRPGPVPTGTPEALSELAVPAPGDEPASDPRWAAFYQQQLDWQSCGERRQCAGLSVPVSWDDPAAGSLELALVRVPAAGQRSGSLVVNPGGPGGSGVTWVGDEALAVAGDAVREVFDVVGFDPRGVARSAPVDCLSDAEMDEFLSQDPAAGLPPGSPQALAALREQAERFAAGCAAGGGQLLGQVDTGSAARDLDVLRAALGEPRLDYLGKSYGTLLGATYAELFPQRAGRMVLDGAVDPRNTPAEALLGQAAGMHRSLQQFAAWCADQGDCPLGQQPAAAVEQVGELLAAVAERPLPTGSPRELTGPLAATGVVQPMYSPSLWPALVDALAQALQQGRGDGLLALADAYSGRQPDGSYRDNLLEAFAAVSCLDAPVDDDPAAMAEQALRLREASPVLGESLAYGALTCGAWPVPPVGEPGPLTAEGAPPLLVVGTTGDNATPYAWSQALADQLTSGRLLTWQGEGHTAYRRADACVDGAVERYLLGEELPGPGATCGG